jgi:hypothetical protein
VTTAGPIYSWFTGVLSVLRYEGRWDASCLSSIGGGRPRDVQAHRHGPGHAVSCREATPGIDRSIRRDRLPRAVLPALLPTGSHNGHPLGARRIVHSPDPILPATRVSHEDAEHLVWPLARDYGVQLKVLLTGVPDEEEARFGERVEDGEHAVAFARRWSGEQAIEQ